MKTLVVDDHVLIREALRRVLAELDPEGTVADASDASEAIAQADASDDLDLILLDLALPDRGGLDVLEELRRSHPAVGVVVISASLDRESITRALELGALGFIPKAAPREVISGALRLVLSGGVYVPPEILRRVVAAPGARAGCR